MLVLHDPDTLLHSTVELLGSRLIPALESPERLQAILAALEASSHELKIIRVEPSTDLDSLLEIITKTHDSEYIDHLKHAFNDWLEAGLLKADESILPECFRLTSPHNPNPRPPKDIFARPGYYAFDMSSGLTATSYTSIIASANLAYQSSKLLFPHTPAHPTPNTILALTRPPGHHCPGHLSGGYCYINNAAIAISTYHSLSPSPKTAVLDLDFHHGNGTQSLFYTDPCTLYISIHGEHEFPYYTGFASETGADEGDGFNLNLPLPTGSSFNLYLEKLAIGLQRLKEFAPAFVVVSLGFDTFPSGSFGEIRD